MRLVAGIDPGKNGAVAVVDADTLKAEVFPMPADIMELARILERYQLKLVVMERQQPFPKQGVKSVFNLGRHYGCLETVIRLKKIPLEIVSPQKWQRELLGNISVPKGLTRKDAKAYRRKETKRRSLERAKRLFPNLAEEIGSHDGKADALNIALWGIRFMGWSHVGRGNPDNGG